MTSILVVQVPTDLPLLDEGRFPDRNDSQIFEHLLRYCSKFEPLPAITVQIERNSAVVLRGHKYLAVARALERPTIRAVIVSPPSSPEVSAFLGRNDVRRLDWEEIRAIEALDRTPKGWHVFFFERSLSPQEKKAFEGGVVKIFGGVEGNAEIVVLHDDGQHLTEFEARTPVEDTAWAAEHLATFSEFSRDCVRIVSYQGQRFAG